MCNYILGVNSVYMNISLLSPFCARQWGAVDAEIKIPPVRTQSVNFLPLKAGVGRYTAIHATLTASGDVD